MTLAGELRSGKGHRDENFPVASHLVHPRFRAPILAFYEFVRVADDIADHASLAPEQKLALLDRLEGSLLGMALTFLAGPALALAGGGLAQALGAATFALIILSFQPILRFYRASPLWGPALPLIALAYMAFTLDSAYQHGRGRGGLWKGRVQAGADAQAGAKAAE